MAEAKADRPAKRRKVIDLTEPEEKNERKEKADSESKAKPAKKAEEAMPTDTETALLLLKSQYPRINDDEVPLALLHQCYNIVADRTAVDRDVDRLKRENKVRVFKLLGQKDEFAIAFTSDIVSKVRSLLVSAPDTTLTRDRKQVLDNFVDRLMPQHWEISITQERLVSLVFEESKFQEMKADDAITFLVNCGLLLSSDPSVFFFAVPGAGALIADIAKGRKEIAKLIQKRKHQEILSKELMKRKLRSTKRGFVFHLRDMIGGGSLKAIKTTLGELLRLNSDAR